MKPSSYLKVTAIMSLIITLTRPENRRGSSYYQRAQRIHSVPSRRGGGGGGEKTVDVAGSEGCAGVWYCRGAGAGVGRRCGAVGTEKVTKAVGAAGRVVARVGGGCRELAPMLEVSVSCWRLTVPISTAVERCWISTWRRRPQRSAWTESREAALACSGCMTRACSSSAKERAQASAAVRAGSPTSTAARARSPGSAAALAWARQASTSWREMETDPGSDGGLHAVPYLMETPEVGGRSARVAQKGPRGTGESGRRPWVRSVPEPEIARSVDEATGKEVP